MPARNSVYAIALLTAVWIILRESASLSTVAAGVVLGAGSVYVCRKLLPMPEAPGIRIFHFAVYLLYLVGQIYIAGIYSAKLVIQGARIEIIETKTAISSLFLRAVLVNSITLVPGSVSIDLKGDKITALWLCEKESDPDITHKAEELILDKLERMLQKAQK